MLLNVVDVGGGGDSCTQQGAERRMEKELATRGGIEGREKGTSGEQRWMRGRGGGMNSPCLFFAAHARVCSTGVL